MIAGMSALSWALVVTAKPLRRWWIETAAAIKKGQYCRCASRGCRHRYISVAQGSPRALLYWCKVCL
jgi:hypothetical protein